jgi:hypothetical protein
MNAELNAATCSPTIDGTRRKPAGRRRRLSRAARRGTVTVEFAFVAPIFIVTLLGVAEASRALSMQNKLASAAREGARIAAMDRTNFLDEGETANDKLIDDVEHLLKANGIDPAAGQLQIAILDHDNPEQTFDLDDPANDYRLFDVRIRLPYNAMTSFTFPGAEEYRFEASVTFRNARSTLIN